MPAKGYKHGDNTPKKALVRGVISYLEAEGLPVNKASIFRHFELTRSQGYAALSRPTPRKDDPTWQETRGRPSKLSKEDVARMEALLWEKWPEEEAAWAIARGHGLNWQTLPKQAGVDTTVNKRTLHRAMGTFNYRRCMACGKSQVHERARERRVEWAKRMMSQMPEFLDWSKVRFGGELHFGFSLDGKVRIIPRAGERECCPSCKPGIQGTGNPETQGDEDAEEETEEAEVTAQPGKWSRDVKRVHAWGALGFNFKSDLVFYEPSTSPNYTGAISMPDYRIKVLEGPVKSWLDAANMNTSGMGPNAVLPNPEFLPGFFMLQEDIDSFGHGGLSKVNPAQQWKESSGLRHHFNCSESPDLNPLDSVWPPFKQWAIPEEEEETTKRPVSEWSDKQLKQAVKDAWTAIDQQRIDLWVEFMPQRLRQVIDGEGHMISW